MKDCNWPGTDTTSPPTKGSAWQKVSGLGKLLAGWREEVLDDIQCGIRVFGVLKHGGAEADRFPVEGLSPVGGEMNLSVGGCHSRIAQVDLIWQTQVGQSTRDSPAQVEEHGVGLASFQLSQMRLIELCRVGIAPQEALFEIREPIVASQQSRTPVVCSIPWGRGSDRFS